ncbi:MAG: UDP-glucose/GDP-mannose dehydrogenase family protein [Chloroflexi bacterium]|nr:UDP-glucose/GDP-mannose dehydrogenase family protein [Chloroflexota bacterium]
MSRIGVIGSGYVGLVTSACFADLGHDVTCVDVDTGRVDLLRRANVPFYEPRLEALVRAGLEAGRLRFSGHHAAAVAGADCVFIAVNTPSAPDGSADLQYLRAAIAGTAASLGEGDAPVVVLKSTAPVGTAEAAAAQIRRLSGRDVCVVSNPEFLREGTAVSDFYHPDRVVIGGGDDHAVDQVAALYAFAGCLIVRCDARTAEMTKYAANAFLATKISFINEMASIAEALGADISRVAEGMGLDRRIGAAYLRPGLGFGGSCLPKDVRALSHMASVFGAHPQLLNAVLQINADQRRRLVNKLRDALDGLDGRIVALLGLAFKPSTDDVREAPSLELIRLLRNEGADVRVYDPAATARIAAEAGDLQVAVSPYEAARGVDAVVLVTEWPQCVDVDFQRFSSVMKGRVAADGRNSWNAAAVHAAGLRYITL